MEDSISVCVWLMSRLPREIGAVPPGGNDPRTAHQQPRHSPYGSPVHRRPLLRVRELAGRSSVAPAADPFAPAARLRASAFAGSEHTGPLSARLWMVHPSPAAPTRERAIVRRHRPVVAPGVRRMIGLVLLIATGCGLSEHPSGTGTPPRAGGGPPASGDGGSGDGLVGRPVPGDQVVIDGQARSRDQVIVFLHIGHSNMA